MDSSTSARLERFITEQSVTTIEEPKCSRHLPLFQPDTCPQGIVNLLIAENRLSEEMTKKKIQECQPDATDTLYFNTSNHGSERLRKAMAKFLSRYMKTEQNLDHDKMIITQGIASALHYLALATADEGDYYIVRAPGYFTLGKCMRYVAGVKFLEVPSFDNGHSFPDAISNACCIAEQEGKKVKGMLIFNPDNPTGRVYGKEEILNILKVCARHKLHVIFDEVYSLAVHGEDAFHSVLSLYKLPDPDRTHFTWSLSKSFGLSGFRIGVIYTSNEKILGYLKKIAVVFKSPLQAQYTIANFLSDHDWLDNVYLPANIHKLRERYQYVKSRLEGMGVTVYPSAAGLFVWANFAKFLRNNTFEAEREFHKQLIGRGVYVVNGEFLRATEPGWFRIVISVSPDHIDEGLHRIEEILETRHPAK